MDQITKDRLFALGLQIPQAVQIRGDTAAVEWAEQEIARAVERGDQPSRVTDQLAAIDARAELAATLDVSTLLDHVDDEELGEMLATIETTAAELKALAAAEGPAAVYARLGNVPALPEFVAWAERVLRPAEEVGAAPEAEPETEDVGEAVPQADGDPTPAGELGAGERAPAAAPAVATGEDLASEEVPAAAPAVATGEGLASEEVPAVADPPSWGMELEAIKERLSAVERRLDAPTED